MSFFVHYVSLRYPSGTANKRPNRVVGSLEELEQLRDELKKEYQCINVSFVYTAISEGTDIEELINDFNNE